MDPTPSRMDLPHGVPAGGGPVSEVCAKMSHRTHRRIAKRRMLSAREKVREFNRGMMRSEYLTRFATDHYGMSRLDDDESDASYRARIVAHLDACAHVAAGTVFMK